MGRSRAGLTGTTVAAFALLGAIAACGQEPEQVGFGGARQNPVPPVDKPQPVEPDVPNGPVPPPGGRELAPTQVDPAALPQGYPQLVWTTDEGRTVGVYGQEGGCSTVRADLLEQTAQTVRIKLVETSESDGPCTMDLRYPDLSVPLAEPLGARTVVLEQESQGVVPGRGR